MSVRRDAVGSESVVSQWARLLPLALRRAPGLAAGGDVPRIEAAATVTIDPVWLARYRNVIGALDDGTLPPCAPQVLAAGLHLQILADPRYPLPVLGMVHLENTIEEHRALPASSTLELRASLEGHRRHAKGVLIDITTEARTGGQLAWRSVLTALIRDATKAPAEAKTGKEPRDAHPPAVVWSSSSTVRLPEDLGRRYGRIAGDANPIHWNSWTARPFGFPRHIIHGMWTLARSLVEVDACLPPRPRRIHARFVRPVFLPGVMVVSSSRGGSSGATNLQVTPLRPGAPHMLADVSRLAEDGE
jgi:acyl dehydratase